MAGAPRRQLQASIIPVLYPKTYIEKHNLDITGYAKEFYNRNRIEGKLVTRRDIEWYWEGNVRAEYDTVDPAHNRLISQIRCPKFETFWMNLTAPVAPQPEKLLQEQQGFQLLRPNEKEKKHFKGALILGNATERWIIPDVSLMAVDDFAHDEFVQNVREANNQHLDRSKVFHLWGALIKKAYGFVPREVQIEKLKEAFSGFPPTTEAGVEEFFGTPSKKRKSAPGSEGDGCEEEDPERTQKRKRVSMGDTYIREFDDESILDPTLKPILTYNYKPTPSATAGPSATASPRSSTEADGGEGGENMVETAEKRIQALEKELAELKIAKGKFEHRLQSQIGRMNFAETMVESLKGKLQESRDRVAQLEKRLTKDV